MLKRAIGKLKNGSRVIFNIPVESDMFGRAFVPISYQVNGINFKYKFETPKGYLYEEFDATEFLAPEKTINNIIQTRKE